MALDWRRIEVVDEAMAEVLRRKTPAERIAIAHGMWRYARKRLEAAVRHQHPDWTLEQVGREGSQRLLNGSY